MRQNERAYKAGAGQCATRQHAAPAGSSVQPLGAEPAAWQAKRGSRRVLQPPAWLVDRPLGPNLVDGLIIAGAAAVFLALVNLL